MVNDKHSFHRKRYPESRQSKSFIKTRVCTSTIMKYNFMKKKKTNLKQNTQQNPCKKNQMIFPPIIAQ